MLGNYRYCVNDDDDILSFKFHMQINCVAFQVGCPIE